MRIATFLPHVGVFGGVRRFIELGKADFAANSRIGLRALRNNIAYHGVDADQLMVARPDLAAAIFREAAELFARGAENVREAGARQTASERGSHEAAMSGHIDRRIARDRMC